MMNIEQRRLKREDVAAKSAGHFPHESRTFIPAPDGPIQIAVFNFASAMFLL